MPDKPVLKNMSVEEYLAYEQGTANKREYVDGKLRLIDEASPQHNKIVLNCWQSLRNQLALSPYLVHNTVHDTNRRIKIDDKNYLHPDIFVLSLDSEFCDDAERIISSPVLIAEVMSPRSKNHDRSKKRERYLKNKNHKIQLYIFEEEPLITIYTPHKDGWLLQDFRGLDAVIPLKAIGCELKLSEAYLDVF